MDEVITPQSGNCTIFARYVEPNFTTQVILIARLTRLYERRNWRERFAAAKNVEPLLLEQGISLGLKPVTVPEIISAANPSPDRAMLERVAERVAGLESNLSPLVPLAKMMEAHRARLAAAQERRDEPDQKQDGERDWLLHVSAQPRRAADAGSIDRRVKRRTGIRRAN